ncbi:MAG: tetratricopeptide repeat protein [Saprospiraceae bacterium]|nr:tetratricopeptide repeat protein [Saprospiraceae bacterium]
MNKILPLFLFYCLAFRLNAQSNTDSLYGVWSNTSLPDTQRLKAMHLLSNAMVRKNPDSARLFATEMLQLAKKDAYPNWFVQSMITIGVSWRMQSDFQRALQYYESCIPLLEKSGNRSLLAEVYKNMGDVYRLQSNYSKAIDCITQSLRLAEASGDRKREADAYVGLSTIYYLNSDNDPKIKDYLLKAQTLYEAVHHEEGLSFVYNNLSLIYFEQNDYPKALEAIRKCLAIQEKKGDLYGMATSLHNRASVYTSTERYEDALKDYEREVEIFNQMGDLEGLSDAFSSIGELWISWKNYGEAIKSCEKALQYASSLGTPNLNEANACICLYKAYSKRGEFQKSVPYLERYYLVKDSLQLSETAQKLKAMEMERDSLTRAKAQFEQEMAYEKNLRQKDRLLVLLLTAGVLIGLVALAIWTRMLYFRRRSLKMQVRSEALEKQQLLHEIDLLRTQVNPHFLFNSLSILSSLVHVNADLSEQFIEQLARSYRYILEQKDQTLVTLRTELEFIRSYAFLLKIRFDNKFDLQINIADAALDHYRIAPLTLQLLVENAVKHNRMSAKEPLIVSIELEDDFLTVRNPFRPRGGVEVASTGVGLQNITNRYALLSDRSVWAGERGDRFEVRVPLI